MHLPLHLRGAASILSTYVRSDLVSGLGASWPCAHRTQGAFEYKGTSF